MVDGEARENGKSRNGGRSVHGGGFVVMIDIWCFGRYEHCASISVLIARHIMPTIHWCKDSKAETPRQRLRGKDWQIQRLVSTPIILSDQQEPLLLPSPMPVPMLKPTISATQLQVNHLALYCCSSPSWEHRVWHVSLD